MQICISADYGKVTDMLTEVMRFFLFIYFFCGVSQIMLNDELIDAIVKINSALFCDDFVKWRREV